ncbi:MAG TPA: transglycosylase family protein [Candidatus Saccharimonadales bacterium]|nr:transglycosylase family protein [Candidatus Saccharimonadales bacterium]
MLTVNAGGAKVHAQTGKNKTVQAQKHKNPKKITVKTGDTLTKIAKKNKTTYPRIFYANAKIKDPDVIFTGEKLRIPSKDEKLKSRPLEGVTHTVPTVMSNVSDRRISPSPQPYSMRAYSPSSGSVWDKIAACESGGNWSINTGNGYYGGLQFTASSWRAAGGSGLPSQASRSEQIARAKILQSRQGWGAWPACTSKLGIR